MSSNMKDFEARMEDNSPVNINKRKILIITDDSTVSESLEQNLSKFGYTVIKATDGGEGLELANSERPDCILADIHLPEIDGIELCWVIRQTSKVPLTPFILLADTEDPEIRVNGFRSGADAFLIKPISMRELITRIETLLKRVEQLTHQGNGPKTAIQGKFPDVTMVELLQMLNLTQKSGTLTLTALGEEKGQIGFLDGKLVWAEMGNYQGEEAIYKMALWHKGYFEFEKDLIFTKVNIQSQPMKIILDCCKLLDESQS